MHSIGIRATPKIVYYSIVDLDDIDGESFSIISCDKVIVPQALETPDQLRYIRNTFFSIISEYNVIVAGIKRTENNAQSISIDRTYIEGVLQELVADCSITKYFASNMSKLAGLLKENISTIKEYCSGELVFCEIPDWDSYSDAYRECIVCAVAATSL